MWKKAGIPTVTERRIVQLIIKEHAKLKSAFKVRKGDAIEKLRLKSTELFDICSCKCCDFSLCSCSIEYKVPKIEQAFLNDQRTGRIQFIGDVDKHETERIRKSHERKQKLSNYYQKESCQQFFQMEAHSSSDEMSEDNIVSVEEDTCERNYTPIPSIAEAADRFDVSNTAAAAIASATLVDFGIVSRDNREKVIDKSKVWRERMKLRKIKVELSNESAHFPKSIYFDGKKDKTRVNMKAPVIEEHVVLIEEPGSLFLTHVCPQNGTAQEIFNEMIQNLPDINVD